MATETKTHFEELAIFGGTPLFETPQHVGRPNIGNRQQLMGRIEQLLDDRWLTNDGPFVRAFEDEICRITGAEHSIAVTNATIALELAIRALGMSGEVILPSFTFVATAHALQWQEITPVFADIAPGTHHLDPASVETMITPRTSGIIGVHVWGRASEIEALTDIAQRHNLALLFDAAHAFSNTHKGQPIGTFGDAEVFSFHATKFINSFEGGAITTNDSTLAERLRFMRNFGFAGYDDVQFLGINGKMSEVSAAMGLTSLEEMHNIVDSNRAHYQTYLNSFAENPFLRIFKYDEKEANNYQYVILEVDNERSPITRDQLVDILHAENILARKYFYPGCHQMEPYRSFFPHSGLLLPNTERLVERVVSLPTGPTLSKRDVSRIASLINWILSQGTDVRERLERGHQH